MIVYKSGDMLVGKKDSNLCHKDVIVITKGNYDCHYSTYVDFFYIKGIYVIRRDIVRVKWIKANYNLLRRKEKE